MADGYDFQGALYPIYVLIYRGVPVVQLLTNFKSKYVVLLLLRIWYDGGILIQLSLFADILCVKTRLRHSDT